MLERPRFRNDLVAQPVNDGSNRYVDVTDPDSGSTFRFYEVEYAVACAMDGKRDTGGLVAWSQTELGLEPSADEINTVVSTLADLGYLAKAAAGDVELGHAGKSDMSSPRPSVSAPDVELGHAGAADDEVPTQVAETPAAPVSVDLSAHLSIEPDDVKEAVRQSRVMSAVEAPTELDEHEAPTTVGGAPLKTKPEAKKPEAPKVPPPKPVEIPAEAPPVKAERPAASAVDQSSKEENESSGGAMTLVLVVLLLGVLAVGGWFVYTNFLAKDSDGASSHAPEPTPAAKTVVKKKLS